MSEAPKMQAEVQSDVRKNPRRIAFILRRTSPQVRTHESDLVMTYPAALSHFVIAMEVVFLALVWISLVANAPLEGLADPMHTPNPAKAPWYFLGLQELLHYFPPFVAGVLVPGLVVMALVVIPYFNVNIEAEGIFTKDRKRRLTICSVVIVALLIFLLVFDVYVALPGTLLIAALLFAAALAPPNGPDDFRQRLAARPLSFWIMTWFLIELAVLTGVGTFF